MAQLVQLDLSKVDLEVPANLENLLDNTVGENQHLLAKSRVGALLAIATDKQRGKFEAHADSTRAVVAV